MRKLSTGQAILVCFAFFLLSALLSWTFGGAALYPWQLLSDDTPDVARHILLSIRLPRLVTACFVGAGLSVSGLLTQGLFRNPLASPSVIGISSGGSLGAILAFFFSLHLVSLWFMPMMAFVGSLLTTLIILALSRSSRLNGVEDLLLVGFALNAILSAISSFLLSLSLTDYDRAPTMMNWMLGTLSGKTWDHALLASIPITLGIIFASRLTYQLNVMAMGHDVAQTLGIQLKSLRRKTILVVSLLDATAVAIGGILPFLGLIVPHISRLLVGPDPKKLLAITILNGMSLLLLADLCARTLLAPGELQVGVLISLFGSPVFLWMLYQRRKAYLV
ncbi:MAG: iron ABC transporter permease [Bdellovibrionota bacterium]